MTPLVLGVWRLRLDAWKHTATALAVLGLMLAAPALASAAGSHVRISQMGPDGDPAFDGEAPAVAYDSTAHRYLVVWQGNDVPGEGAEIYGRFVAATGAPIGGEFRVSDAGPDGNANFDALKPAVDYNARTGEYLVVWYGDEVADGELEIYGQRLNSAGAEVGANDFRISQTGPDGMRNFDAFRPAVSYNPLANEYLVTWYADAGGQDEFEIFAQRLNGAGAEVGASDFRVSDMGPDGNGSFDAFKPAVTYSSRTGDYLVVWYGDDGVDEKSEIYGQRLTATGAEVGANDFRISDMGPDGDPRFSAARAAVSYDSAADEYMVVWDGDDDTGARVDNEFEIYGQRVSASGAEVGPNDFRVSDMGKAGSGRFDALRPVVANDPSTHEYLVVWYGDDATDEETEIYGQRLSASGAELGEDDFRVSQMGADGDPRFGAQDPALASGQVPAQLAVWSADDSSPPLVDDELEIFGSRVGGGAGGVATDRRRPYLKLSARRRQRLLRQRAVLVRAWSDERVTLVATGRLSLRKRRGHRTIRLKRLTRSVSARRRAKLRFKLSRRTRRLVRRNLRRHRSVVARVTVRVTDAAGNSTTKKIRIRARR
jgi:hypothetical protein